MIWLLYNLLFPVVFVLALPFILVGVIRRGGYRNRFGQRFGRYAPEVLAALAAPPRIWVHSVSVGELQVGLKLIQRLRDRLPGSRYILTVTTSTADAIARREAHPDDLVLYFPLDFPWVIPRVLRQLRPRAFVMVESEYWPNLLRGLSSRGIPVCLANGRISDRSYGRYLKARFFTRRLLPHLRLFCMQSEEDRARMVELGAPADRVEVLASAKYETAARSAEREALAGEALARIGFAGRPLLMGGSTWPGEDAVLARVFKRLQPRHPELRLLIAPRHAEKSGDIVRTLQAEGLSFVARKEMGALPPAAPPQVLLLNTTGELMAFYAHASVVFIGKSLCERGGQNPIEPALCGKPVVTGPNMSNFTRILRDFAAEDAVVQIADEEALVSAVDGLLSDPARAAAMGARAGALVRRNAGALTATADRIVRLLSAG